MDAAVSQAVALTVASATISACGKALQKGAARRLPRFACDRKTLAAFARDRGWAAGVALDCAGAVLQLRAYADAPVSLVQPVSGIGLVVLAVLAHVFLNERLSAGEWAAAGVATAGAALLGATSPPAPPPPSAQRLVVVLALSTLAVLIGPTARARLAAARRARRAGPRPRTPSKPPPAPSATAQGARAGVVFGLGATACRAGFALGAGRPPVVAAGVAASTLLSALGMAIQTAALKTGASVGVCTAAAVSSMLSGAALGIAALGEPFAPSPAALPARVAAWALTLAGVAALAGGGVTKVAAGAVPPALRARLPVRVAAALRRAASASLPTSVKE